MSRDRRTVYLDYNATTPLDPRVAHAMRECWQHPGNASSRVNASARRAQEQLRQAAEDLAVLCGARSSEIVWTSGATEANNMAILSSGATRGSQILTLNTEHASVLAPIRALGEFAPIAVRDDGRLAIDDVLSRVGEDTRLISIMLVNNEIGVIQPISELSRQVRKRFPHILIHCDASQAAATQSVDVQELGVDMLSLSAHKIYGPQGIGALWAREGISVRSVLCGGHQQQSRRPGTIAVPLAVGFGAAARICLRQRDDDARRIRILRDTLLADLRATVHGVHLNGSLEHRSAGNLNLFFEGIFSEDLVEELTDIEFSLGSACHGEELEPSHVLQALSRPERLHSSIRLCVGRMTTREEIVFTGRRFREAICNLRALTRECA